MKQVIYLFICLFIYSCKAQNISELDIKRENIIIFNFYSKNESILTTQKLVYKNEKTIISSVLWSNEDMGVGCFKRNFKFIQKKDTMDIICNHCGSAGTKYYFKNLEFKKGSYELRIEYPKKYNKKEKRFEKDIKYIFGKEIHTSKEVQNILFKNADYEILRNPKYLDLYFKDLKFIEIDLKDTINMKLNKFKNEY